MFIPFRVHAVEVTGHVGPAAAYMYTYALNTSDAVVASSAARDGSNAAASRLLALSDDGDNDDAGSIIDDDDASTTATVSSFASETPQTASPVFTMLGHSDRHLYRASSGAWWISNTAQMLAGQGGGGVIASKETGSETPLDLTWGARGLGADPLLTVRALDEAQLALAVGAAESAAEASRAVHFLRVAGHVGTRSHLMGPYALNAAASPTNGANVYTHCGRDVHVYRAINDRWLISTSYDMQRGANTGFIGSMRATLSPVEKMQWEVSDSGWKVDPALRVVAIPENDPELLACQRKAWWISRAVDVGVVVFALACALFFKRFY